MSDLLIAAILFTLPLALVAAGVDILWPIFSRRGRILLIATSAVAVAGWWWIIW